MQYAESYWIFTESAVCSESYSQMISTLMNFIIITGCSPYLLLMGSTIGAGKPRKLWSPPASTEMHKLRGNQTTPLAAEV